MSDLDLARSGESPATSRSGGPGARNDGRLRRVIEGEILPRFLLSRRVAPVPKTLSPPDEHLPDLERDGEEFMALVRAAVPQHRIDDFLEETVERGYPIEAVLDALVTPVARRLGIMWEEDECDFFEVTVVCSRLQSAIRRLSSRFSIGNATPRGRILVGGLPGAEHSLGFLMVAEAFARAGYAISLGEPLVHGISPRGFDILALTVTRTAQARQARDFIARARGLAGPGLRVIVGGFAFRSEPGLVEMMNADGWAEDPVSAVRLVDQMLNPDTSRVPEMVIPTRPLPA